jgi:hypothetical protein
VSSAAPRIAIEAVTSIEDVGSRIEDVFARVGGDLGHAHTMFERLNADIDGLGHELSAANIDSASQACRDIAARLGDLAEVLPAETALLTAIGTRATQASVYLKDILKHIDMITIIARASRIEAASLDGDSGDFLNFTKEASDLANAVQLSIVGCAKEQQQLAGAIAEALKGQSNFERHYRPQLLTASKDLTSACTEIENRQSQSAQLAELARTSTADIGTAVGAAIVALQAGDSTRQRLEHICHALHSAAGGIAPIMEAEAATTAASASFVRSLQAAQLNDAIAGFAVDVATIIRSLSVLAADSAAMVERGRSLCGAQDKEMMSFLAAMKQRLSTALALIAACGCAKMAVDDSIAVLETMLAKFRSAISSLGHTIADITMIGMNAGLKASHLGVRGRAFVVIANELKATADRIAAGEKLLGPAVDGIAAAAVQLKNLRKDEQALQVAELEASIVHALGNIEAGNGRLARLLDSLTGESARFETLVVSAKGAMADLGEKFSTLSGVAATLEVPRPMSDTLSADEVRAVDGLFDELFVRYTMVKERDVHRRFATRYPFLSPKNQVAPAHTDVTDDIFF